MYYMPGSLKYPATQGYSDYRVYYDNVLRNIEFIDKLPDSYLTYNETDFHFKHIDYVHGTNLLLNGYFQSEKYFANNKDYILNLYRPTSEIKSQILSDLPDIQSCVSIHVRRGDYLQLPHHHPLQNIDYYANAVSIIGTDRKYVIFSDDLGSCIDMFDFIPNKAFYTSNKNWFDMYAMSMCSDNIICNSTFSWWGAWLNENIEKKVIAPYKWFGQAYSHWNTQDLIPESWQVI